MRESVSGEVTLVNGAYVFYARVLLSPTVSQWLSLTAFNVVGRSPPANVYVHAATKQRQYTGLYTYTLSHHLY